MIVTNEKRPPAGAGAMASDQAIMVATGRPFTGPKARSIPAHGNAMGLDRTMEPRAEGPIHPCV